MSDRELRCTGMNGKIKKKSDRELKCTRMNGKIQKEKSDLFVINIDDCFTSIQKFSDGMTFVENRKNIIILEHQFVFTDLHKCHSITNFCMQMKHSSMLVLPKNQFLFKFILLFLDFTAHPFACELGMRTTLWRFLDFPSKRKG